MHLYTYYGSYLKFDTASFESSHKVLTKGIYNKTSRQTNIFHQEMLTKSIEQEIHHQYSFIGNALSVNVEDHLKLLKIPTMTENITFTLIYNLPYFKLQFSEDQSRIILTDNKNLIIDDPSNILIHSSLTVYNMLSVLDKLFPDKSRNELINELHNNNVKVTIRSGVTYNANIESGMGSGHLYASAKCGRSIERPKYDYILVNTSDETTGNINVQPAQLIGILEVTQLINNEISTEVCYIIQYMTESLRNGSEVKSSPFKLFTWEYIKGGNITTNPKYNIDVINHESINGQAYIFPYFNGEYCPRNHYATTGDLFWLVDRKYFDRSGWEEYTENIMNTTGILLKDFELKEFERTIPISDDTNDIISNSSKRKHYGNIGNKLSRKKNISIHYSSSTNSKIVYDDIDDDDAPDDDDNDDDDDEVDEDDNISE